MTENGVTDKNCCTEMTVIFARGTGEPGNVGVVSGPPMFKAIREKLGAGNVTVQGLDYAASSAVSFPLIIARNKSLTSLQGNTSQGGDGGKKMAALVDTALTQCPSTKIVLVGYSQGAMVVHNAFSNGLTSSKVSGAVLFGDPLKKQTIGDLSAEKIKQFCGTSDMICEGGGDGGATGSYGASADAAASFAIQVAGCA
jgi:cutinase